MPQAAPGSASVGPSASVDNRLVAAGQRLLPGYTYGALTDTAESVCDSFQRGASWEQELQTRLDMGTRAPSAASFMQISILAYCHTFSQVVPISSP